MRNRFSLRPTAHGNPRSPDSSGIPVGRSHHPGWLPHGTGVILGARVRRTRMERTVVSAIRQRAARVADPDLEERSCAETLLAGENRLLQMIARGDALGVILDQLCRLV